MPSRGLTPFLILWLVNCASSSITGADVAQVDGHSINKRQIYYLCGSYPKYYYSLYPCYVSGDTKCSNGGVKIGIGCSIANQCVPYHRGPVACLQGCCCTVPTTPNRVDPNAPGSFGYCQNGQLSKVPCSAPNQCAAGQSCINGLCCTTVQDQYKTACGGEYAVSQCSASRTCTQGYTCTASNSCCQCPVGKSGGRCNQGLCANGFSCMDNGYCCASCPGNVTPFGACLNGKCGGGRRCVTGNICC